MASSSSTIHHAIALNNHAVSLLHLKNPPTGGGQHHSHHHHQTKCGTPHALSRAATEFKQAVVLVESKLRQICKDRHTFNIPVLQAFPQVSSSSSSSHKILAVTPRSASEPIAWTRSHNQFEDDPELFQRFFVIEQQQLQHPQHGSGNGTGERVLEAMDEEDHHPVPATQCRNSVTNATTESTSQLSTSRQDIPSSMDCSPSHPYRHPPHHEMEDANGTSTRSSSSSSSFARVATTTTSSTLHQGLCTMVCGSDPNAPIQEQDSSSSCAPSPFTGTAPTWKDDNASRTTGGTKTTTSSSWSLDSTRDLDETEMKNAALCLGVSTFNLALFRHLRYKQQQRQRMCIGNHHHHHKQGNLPHIIATLYESAFVLLTQVAEVRIQDSAALILLAICTNLCALYYQDLADLDQVRHWKQQLSQDPFVSSLRYHYMHYQQQRLEQQQQQALVQDENQGFRTMMLDRDDEDDSVVHSRNDDSTIQNDHDDDDDDMFRCIHLTSSIQGLYGARAA